MKKAGFRAIVAAADRSPVIDPSNRLFPTRARGFAKDGRNGSSSTRWAERFLAEE